MGERRERVGEFAKDEFGGLIDLVTEFAIAMKLVYVEADVTTYGELVSERLKQSTRVLTSCRVIH